MFNLPLPILNINYYLIFILGYNKMKVRRILVIISSILISISAQEHFTINGKHFYSSINSPHPNQFGLGSEAALSVEMRIDSLIATGLNGVRLKSIIEYEDERVVENITKFDFGTGWENYSREQIAYNILGKIVVSKSDAWLSDSGWINDARNVFEFNDAGNETLSLFQVFEEGIWKDLGRTLTEYKSDFQEKLLQYNLLGEWVNQRKMLDYIDHNGNIDSSYVMDWNGIEWIPKQKIYREYHSNGSWKYIVILIVDNNSWNIAASVENIFDNNGRLLKYHYYDWSNNFEELVSRLVYNYDSEGYLVEVINEYNSPEGWQPAEVDPIVINYPHGYSAGYIFYKVNLFYSVASNVDESDELQKSFVLFQNYPNPFNPSTTIKFNLPKKSNVKLSVYNSIGQKVDLIFEGIKGPGIHEIVFENRNLSSGIYFCVLETDKKIFSQKMLLLK